MTPRHWHMDEEALWKRAHVRPMPKRRRNAVPAIVVFGVFLTFTLAAIVIADKALGNIAWTQLQAEEWK